MCNHGEAAIEAKREGGGVKESDAGGKMIGGVGRVASHLRDNQSGHGEQAGAGAGAGLLD